MGERARFYRLLRRKTIRQLASECGCSPDTIARLENGRYRPTLDTLRRVADALNVGWWDLWVNPLPETPEGVPAPCAAAVLAGAAIGHSQAAQEEAGAVAHDKPGSAKIPLSVLGSPRPLAKPWRRPRSSFWGIRGPRRADMIRLLREEREGSTEVSEENKATSRRFYEELFNQGNLDAAEELVTPDFVVHDPNMPEEPRGPEGLKGFVAMYRNAFPDIAFAIEDQVAEGEKVGTRWVARGTHRGELMGIAPTGNAVEVRAFTLQRFSGGKIAEDWAHDDALGMMRQLGAVPA